MGVTWMESTRGGLDESLERSFRPGALTSYEALVAGGDMTKEILLRRKQSNVDKILADVVREMLMQKLASLHFDAISNWVLFAPTMIVTLLSAIISIFSTSEAIEDPLVKTQLTILVACLQLCLSVLQSLSKQLDFSAKAGFHRSAAKTLQKIYGNARHQEYENRYQSMFKALKENKRLSIGFNAMGDIPEELRSSSSSSSTSSDDDSHNSEIRRKQRANSESRRKEREKSFREKKMKRMSTMTMQTKPPAAEPEQEQSQQDSKKSKDKEKHQAHTESLGKQFKQAVEQVESFVPVKIANAFNVMEARIKVLNESLMTDKTNSLVAWEQVLPALYFQLAETIIEWPGWPFFIPLPSQSVEKTLKEFKESLHTDRENSADLLMDILDRSSDIFTVNKRLAKKREAKEKRDTYNLTEQLRNAIKELGVEGGIDESENSVFNPVIYPKETDPLVPTAVV